MKTKIPIFVACLFLLIAGINFWLWYSPLVETDAERGLLTVPTDQKTSVQSAGLEVELSDDAEYPAPVIQLQRVLAKSYQSPVHGSEEMFPDDSLKPDDKASAKAEVKAEIDQLRKRIKDIETALN